MRECLNEAGTCICEVEFITGLGTHWARTKLNCYNLEETIRNKMLFMGVVDKYCGSDFSEITYCVSLL